MSLVDPYTHYIWYIIYDDLGISIGSLLLLLHGKLSNGFGDISHPNIKCRKKRKKRLVARKKKRKRKRIRSNMSNIDYLHFVYVYRTIYVI